MKIVLALAPVIPGLVATFYWWKAATAFSVVDKPPPDAGPEDLFVPAEQGEFVAFVFAGQYRTNRTAAGWTAIAVFVHTVASLVSSL